MKYKAVKNKKYDFAGQSYAAVYPNLHKYPATMLPQIGIEIFKELNLKNGKMLNPYCGSGSSFAAGLERKFQEMRGYDINPLAVLISKAKFTRVDLEAVKNARQNLRESVFDFIKVEKNIKSLPTPNFYNINFWFSKQVLENLSVLKHFIFKIPSDIRSLFLVAFSETVRDCSYTRNNEFKLYRMKSEDVLNFNPDVFGVYFAKLNKVIDIYQYCYFPKLNGAKIEISYNLFPQTVDYFDVVLTSPPYGDSRTTVAYGQFSMFGNEWLGIDYARQVDNFLMGGQKVKTIFTESLITDYIQEIEKSSPKRALEVSSFYIDLDKSIRKVSKSIKRNGKAIYVVGNRRVKDVQLPTDQFIAEKFEANGFSHLFTYERNLGNKSMPLKNSPSNKIGESRGTMTKEFIVVCEKTPDK
ncbi:MAG: modification methylase [Pyrinomonadaceae bacterium]